MAITCPVGQVPYIRTANEFGQGTWGCHPIYTPPSPAPVPVASAAGRIINVQALKEVVPYITAAVPHQVFPTVALPTSPSAVMPDTNGWQQTQDVDAMIALLTPPVAPQMNTSTPTGLDRAQGPSLATVKPPMNMTPIYIGGALVAGLAAFLLLRK